MNPHILALAIADAPRPTVSAPLVLPEPSFTGAPFDPGPDLDLTEYATPKPNRAQRRAAARRSKA